MFSLICYIDIFTDRDAMAGVNQLILSFWAYYKLKTPSIKVQVYQKERVMEKLIPLSRAHYTLFIAF